MDYSILEYINEIEEKRFLLPALQRGMVWEAERIEYLFDSLIKSFPIGSFLFWEVEKDTANSYVFYEFIDDYSEKDGGSQNQIAISSEKPTQKEKITAVIDGQQRLSALYIGLHGTYSAHIKYHGWHEDKSFIEKEIYVNLFANLDDEDSCIFKFLSIDDLKDENITKNCLWFRVKDLIKKGITTNNDKKNEEIQVDLETELEISSNVGARTILSTLIKSLTKKDILKCYYYSSNKIDDVLEAFVRTNSQGKPLSKADLIFSTIVADNPDFRNTIENYLKIINTKGNIFNFDKDFILKACQMIVNKTPKNDIKSIKGKIKEIYNSWDIISEETTYVVDVLDDLGFDGTTITAKNAILPIIYYKNKVGRDLKEDEIQVFYRYIICSFVKGVFGGSSDNVLQNMMNEINELIKNKEEIDFNWLRNVQLKKDGIKTFAFTEDEITHILETYEKGSVGAYQILLLLYNNLRFKDRYFHQDHIHAASLFNKRKLEKLGIVIDKDKLKEWQSKCNLLPNLQLLEKKENIKKKDELYEDWYNNHQDLKDNYIDYNNWSLKLKDFDEFFELRKEKMFKELKKILVF